jgi:hypothetical protein
VNRQQARVRRPGLKDSGLNAAGLAERRIPETGSVRSNPLVIDQGLLRSHRTPSGQSSRLR